MKHMAARIAALGGLLALLSLSACGSDYRPLQPGAAGYQHATYGYVVAYRAGSQALLQPGWAPHPHATVTRALPLDYDGDGAVDDELDVPVFDLLYSHSATAGTVFVSTFPTSRAAAEGDLEGILRGYVATSARANQIAYGFPRTVTGVQAMATRVLGSRPRMVDGRAAHELLYEVADVPTAQVTDATRWRRGHIVLVRPDLTFSDRQYSLSRGSSTAAFHPVLLVLGYANTAADFAAQHNAFEDLIGRLRFVRDPGVERLRGELGTCVGAETLVEFLVLPEGRVGAHATLTDPTREPCISRTLVRAELSRAHWPRTFAVRVTPSDR